MLKPTRMIGCTLDPTSQEATIQKEKKIMVKLQEGMTFTKDNKKDLTALIEKMIEHIGQHKQPPAKATPKVTLSQYDLATSSEN